MSQSVYWFYQLTHHALALLLYSNQGLLLESGEVLILEQY